MYTHSNAFTITQKEWLYNKKKSPEIVSLKEIWKKLPRKTSAVYPRNKRRNHLRKCELQKTTNVYGILGI